MKNHTQRTTIILMILTFIIGIAGITGCTKKDAAAAASKADAARPKRVVTTFTILQDMAQNIAGDKLLVESITKPGAEIHEYEPTPLDIVKA